jgi:hypothetical protein
MGSHLVNNVITIYYLGLIKTQFIVSCTFLVGLMMALCRPKHVAPL